MLFWCAGTLLMLLLKKKCRQHFQTDYRTRTVLIYVSCKFSTLLLLNLKLKRHERLRLNYSTWAALNHVTRKFYTPLPITELHQSTPLFISLSNTACRIQTVYWWHGLHNALVMSLPPMVLSKSNQYLDNVSLGNKQKLSH